MAAAPAGRAEDAEHACPTSVVTTISKIVMAAPRAIVADSASVSQPKSRL